MTKTIGITQVKDGVGKMLHLAEMSVVQDINTRQPAEVLAQNAAYSTAKGLLEIEPLPEVIKQAVVSKATDNNEVSVMQHLRLLTLALTFIVGQVMAGPLEDANAAYARGDYRTALRLYLPLAEGGDVKAQSHLGLLYAHGDGLPKNEKQAMYWFLKAADQGDVWAEHMVGIFYTTGSGVPKDKKQAMYWFRKAADQGDAESQAQLGWAYYFGTGVKKDLQQAYFWYLLSTNGAEISGPLTPDQRELSVSLRDEVASHLTQQQRLAAEHDYVNWMPSKP